MDEEWGVRGEEWGVVDKVWEFYSKFLRLRICFLFIF